MRIVLVAIGFFSSFISCFCPLCPVVGTALINSGLSSELAGALASVGSVPFFLAFLDGFRVRKMTFIYPEEDQVFEPGETKDLFVNTYGLFSFFRGRTADIWILNGTFHKVVKVASEREFRIIKAVKKRRGRLDGVGHFSWTIPELPEGRYYIKYVSGWTLWRHESKFSALSPSFLICPGKVCHDDVPEAVDPLSFDTESAPLELQFLYPHWNGIQTAIEDFGNGLVDIPETLARGAVSALAHPVKSAKSIFNNPIKGVSLVMNKFEDSFERNPFRATGQAIAAGSLLYPLVNSFSAGNAACPGGSCALVEAEMGLEEIGALQAGSEIGVTGTSCSGCTNSITAFLKDKKVAVSFGDVADKASVMTVHTEGVSVKQLQGLLHSEFGDQFKLAAAL